MYLILTLLDILAILVILKVLLELQKEGTFIGHVVELRKLKSTQKNLTIVLFDPQ